MNILYCGDRNIEEGLVLSVISLLHNVNKPLCIYVLTVDTCVGNKILKPVTDKTIGKLDRLVKSKNVDGFVKKIDVTDMFVNNLPIANMDTRFTPCCMLRLFSDMILELPDKLLYLDNDVICRKDFSDFYDQDLGETEFAGVLDYYGSWLFRNKFWRRDYINSGVLLFNIKKIKQTGLFRKCRNKCRDQKMFMPDQSALNKLALSKKIMPRRYNEQRKLHDNTVFHHFTTSFRVYPPRTVNVKPWQTERMHNELKIYEYDDILLEHQNLMKSN